MKKAFLNLRSLINGQNFLIAVILVLASFLRLYRIKDYMTFLGDEGRDVLVVYNILHGHLTLLGPTSSVGGFFLGPIYYYFMAPFLLLFNFDPVGPAIMVALIGIATVGLIYKFAGELFNKKVALMAAFLYAVSPIVIAYSRSSWNPNPLPFFSLLIIYILYKNVENKNKKILFFAGILLGIAMQLHYLASFLTIIVFVYLLCSEFIIFKSNVVHKLLETFKKYVIIFVGFLIGWSPFLAFELRHGFPDFIHIFDFVIHSGNTGASSNYFQTVQDVFFRLFARLVYAYPDSGQFHWYNPMFISIWFWASLFLALGCFLVLAYLFYKSFKDKSKDLNKYLLMFVWIFLGVTLFGFYKKSIYEYYFSFMFPLPFILTGLFIYKIYDFGKNKLFLLLSITVFVVLAILNLWGIPFRYEPNRQLNQMKTIADFVMTKTNAKPFNFALISSGNSDYAYRYFFTIWNHPPRTIEYAGVDPQRATVTDQLLVVCESPLPCSPVGNSLWEIAGFGRTEIAGHWKVSVVEVYKLVHYKEKNDSSKTSKSK